MQTVTSLLLDEARPAAGAPWLVLGGEADLANALAECGDVHWLPLDVREQRAAGMNVVVLDDIAPSAYGRVFLPALPDRDAVRRLLIISRDALEPGGGLIVAGANSEGAKSVIADGAAIFGDPAASGYRQKHRVARFITPAVWPEPPAWTREEGIVPGTWRRFSVETPSGALELQTQPGVFAGERLDAGTSLLLEHLEVPDGARVLDVGCGAGIIGIVASRLGAFHVDLVDANLLAVQTAAHNLERLGVPGRALASDVYDGVAGERYDLIVSNPPFHRGKQVDTSVADRLIGGAPHHLRPDGRLLLVANAFLAYGKVMERSFREVTTVAGTRQYHVLSASDPR
jgi:16S rRNA (guanine1207-N2)-methyltransferase